MTILGIHHITLVNRDAEQAKDFYVRVLGLHALGRSADEAGGTERLYFGDANGSAGSIVACSIQPQARRGLHGIGGTHHFALAAPDYDALLMWKRRVTDLGVAVRGPYDRKYFQSIYLSDPDGGVVEIATAGPGFAVDEPADALGREDRIPPDEAAISGRSEDDIKALTWGEPVPEITPEMALSRGMHHITAIGSDIRRTHDFFGGLLGMPLVKRTFNFDDLNSRHWYWGTNGGQPGRSSPISSANRKRHVSRCRVQARHGISRWRRQTKTRWRHGKRNCPVRASRSCTSAVRHLGRWNSQILMAKSFRSHAVRCPQRLGVYNASRVASGPDPS